MPRIRQKAGEYRAKDFLLHLEEQKIRMGIRSDRDLADRLDMTPNNLCYRKKDLENRMTVAEFRKLINVLDMPTEAVLAFLE